MRPTSEPALLTVATTRERGKKHGIEVLFNEREQIFMVPPSAKNAETVLARVREAQERDAPVRVTLNPRRGVVTRVAPPSDEELRAFEESRALLDKPEKTRRIDVSTIDPTTFNIVDYYLNVPVFRLCTNVIPSYKVAKDIFDFCAAQSCHLGGPFAISPCIPFQYVRDGCHARAHKMRRIIVDRFGYCCEKVFSFGNQGTDQLAVRANKWGGCCVTWWFHVAPLVRVRIRVRLPNITFQLELALVIDPGIFDKPVLLSTWLAAQEDRSCSSRARVSRYSIQPGDAYLPADYAGTTFTTDPAYAKTDQVLTDYRYYTTCPAGGWLPPTDL